MKCRFCVTCPVHENCLKKNHQGKAKVFKNDHFLDMFIFGGVDTVALLFFIESFAETYNIHSGQCVRR